MQINLDKRSYIHPKEMDFISYVLGSKDEFDTVQMEWYKLKIKTRFDILHALLCECLDKGIALKIISNDLNNEYNDLFFLCKKYDLIVDKNK